MRIPLRQWHTDTPAVGEARVRSSVLEVRCGLVAVAAGMTAVQAPVRALPAEAASTRDSCRRPEANVLLVHGAWVAGSSWNALITILQRRGHTVLTVQPPLTSLAHGVAWTRHVLAERLQGPTVASRGIGEATA